MAEWSSRYPYTDNNVSIYLPASEGVYRLIYKKGEKYYVFYVGQSDDLRYLQNFNCLFKFIEISLQFERDRIEEEEIEKYKPPCNN